MKLHFASVFITCLVIAHYVESTDLESPRAKPKRYRLSGILLMLNYDGIRVDLITIIEMLTSGSLTIGELIRKADFFFTNAEIKGKISVELPNGETATILERKDYSPFSFAEPVYFSVVYDGHSTNKFKITCDMDEKDSVSSDDTVCKGTQSYRARKLNIFGRQMDEIVNTYKEELSNMTKGADDIIPILVNIMQRFGYEKLYNPEGASNLQEIFETLIKLVGDIGGLGPIDILKKLIIALGDISGVFLVDMTVEKVSDGDGTYKRIDDSWSIIDNYEGLNELYGQVYILPQAKIMNINDVLESVGQIIPLPDIPENIQNFIKDLELPFTQGPAFPLFDLSRPGEKNNGFEMNPKTRNPFSVYFKNTVDKKYVVFANLWEYDGDLAVTFDDCFVKGNALGLETIDFTSDSTFQMSQCDNDDIHTNFYREKDITNDGETDLVEYELAGTFNIYCTSDPGNWYEPYGEFSISVGGRSINQKFMIWKVDSYITVKNKHSYVQSFIVRFRESSSFMDSSNDITFFGKVTESDSTSDDDPIGNYDGHVVDAQFLSVPRTYKFDGEDNNAVTINMQLKPVVDNQSLELIDYVLTGVFDFWTTDGAGAAYEPYGDFNIDMGNRQENLNYQVWHSDKGELEILDGQHYSQNFKKEFQELSNFVDSGQTSSQIVLHGTVWEWDTGGDDVIGNYEGATYKPSELQEAQTYEFKGDGSSVTITLQVEKKEDIPTMVTFKMTGKLRIYCYGDAGKGYEPIGNLYIDVGTMPENQKFEAWRCDPGCGAYTQDSTWTVIDFEREFQELDNFLDDGKSTYVTFHGAAWEDDNIGDDLLGDYDGKKYLAHEFIQETTKTYPGSYYLDETEIVLKIERSSSMSSSKAKAKQESSSDSSESNAKEHAEL